MVKMYRGTMPRKCRTATTVNGTDSLRSETPFNPVSAAVVAPFKSFGVCFFAAAASLSSYPVLNHNAIAIIVKFAATNMALGKYVPILTNRFVCISK